MFRCAEGGLHEQLRQTPQKEGSRSKQGLTTAYFSVDLADCSDYALAEAADGVEAELLAHIERGMESGSYLAADPSIVSVSYVSQALEPGSRQLRCKAPPAVALPPVKAVEPEPVAGKEGPDTLIVGIAVGCMALVLLFILVPLFVRHRRRHRKRLEADG